MLRRVVDTNVLVSALVARRGVCGQLLDAGVDGRWRLVVSPLLLVELEDVLGRKKFSRIAIAKRIAIAVNTFITLIARSLRSESENLNVRAAALGLAGLRRAQKHAQGDSQSSHRERG